MFRTGDRGPLPGRNAALLYPKPRRLRPFSARSFPKDRPSDSLPTARYSLHLLVNGAFFHYEADVLQIVNVGERITRDRNDVRILSRLDRDANVRLAQQVGGVLRGGLDRLQRR